MAVEEFFLEIDRRWKIVDREPITLRVIGSAALMLQTEYGRGTKDSDILEVNISSTVKQNLLDLAGKGSELFHRHRMYLDIVQSALPFLPQQKMFHAVPALSAARSFRFEVLDITEVALSKLGRFNANDADDIREMVRMGKVDHARLIDGFKRAADRFSVDARAEDLPRYLRNLHTVEREHFGLPETDINLPG